MAEEFKLGPDEAVVLRMKKVGYGEGFQLPPMLGGNELILTTQNLILLKKDLFGSTTDTLYFPLKDVKIVGGRPQVRKGNPAHMEYALEVYFNSGMESFRFEWESDIDNWVGHIVSIITGEPIKEESPEEMMADLLSMAEAIEAPVDKMRSIFGIKSTTQVSCKCPACGASLTGIKGETEKCPYCGTYHTF